MKRLNSVLGIGLLGLMLGIGGISMAACGDDDDDNGGSGGKGGSAGTSGKGGTGGTSGSSGTGGSAGSAGSGGSAGSAGSAGSGGSAGSAGAAGSGGGAITCSSPKEAFAKLGGEPTFRAVTNSIIKASLTANDDGKAEVLGKSFAIGKSFAVVGTPGHLTPAEITQNLGDFLILAYGGPDNYSGESMEKAHSDLKISSAQYDQFVGMLVQILTTPKADGGEYELPAETLTSCLAPPLLDPAFKASIVDESVDPPTRLPGR